MKRLSLVQAVFCLLYTDLIGASPQASSLRRRLEDDTKDLQRLEQGDTTEQDDYEDEIINQVAQSAPRGLVDLVHLVPFDVQIAVTVDWGIQTHEVSNIVTDWMNQAYMKQLQAFGYTEANRYAAFDSVVLFDNAETEIRRQLQAGELYTAKFRGGAVFSRSEVRTKSVPANDVLLIQQVTLLNDTALTTMLQESSVLGFGPAVVDVNAFLNPTKAEEDDVNGGADMDMVIIVAIGVACVAFLFLLGAIFWAYRFDRQNREAFMNDKVRNHQTQIDRTDSDTDKDESPEKAIRKVPSTSSSPERSPHFYPAVIGGDGSGDYPESVISDSLISGSLVSEDISTSLSQYYRAGMGRISKTDYARGGGLLDDEGSVSSMESYGYSLDGGATTTAATVKENLGGERIGGLPVAPAAGYDESDTYEHMVEDVQIPDLDKELAELDIKLSPSDDDDCNENASYNLEEYQKQDFEELEQIKSSGASMGSLSAVDIDNMHVTCSDDSSSDEARPKSSS